MVTIRRGAVSLLVLGTILGLGWLAYTPALTGALLLDDVSNLADLARVDDLRSALMFVFSGDAGPLGRPIALATFALQESSWGGEARPFLVVNVLIHLANAALLCWVFHQLARLAGIESRAFVALAASAAWLFMPLLASSSLMVIQRMTTLSATFVLLGVACHLHLREGLERTPRRALILMGSSLVVFTALAALTKESGALLPVYVLVIEATLLARPVVPGRAWTLWKGVFLGLPTLAIAGYLVSCVPYGEALELSRGFSGWERLLTQARILWQYLFHAFVPQPGAFGPFHDGYPVARTVWDPLTLAALAGWVAAVVLAVLWRRRRPLFAFGVLWFAAGHLLESTVVALELYFEHRNYLPVAGPIFAALAALARVPVTYRKLARAGAVAYVAVSALVLFSNTSLWGNPWLAAIYWEMQFPESVRAATTAAEFSLKEEGPQAARRSLEKLAERKPEAAYVLIPALSLSCIISPGEGHEQELEKLARLLRGADFSFTVGTMLSDLYTTSRRVNCSGVTGDAVIGLAEAVLRNERYAKNGGYKRLHHQLLARILRDRGEFEQALAHLRRAGEYGRDAELNMMVVTTYADADRIEDARDFIEAARQDPPAHPVRRMAWQTGLDELATYIEMLEARGRASGTGVQTP